MSLSQPFGPGFGPGQRMSMVLLFISGPMELLDMLFNTIRTIASLSGGMPQWRKRNELSNIWAELIGILLL